MAELNSWPLQPAAQERWESALLDEVPVIAGELAVAEQVEQPSTSAQEEVRTTRHFKHPAPTPGDAPRPKNPTPADLAAERRPMEVARAIRRGPVVPRGFRR